MSTTSIEWTEETWNPVTGCSLVSPGCTHCYAMTMAARLEAMGQAKYAGTTKRVNGKAVWTGKMLTHDDALTIPLRRKKPTTWFVNSMSDLFHEGVPFDFVDKVFAVMALTPHHTYQILTKRPERMAEYLERFDRRTRGEIESDLAFALATVEVPAGSFSARSWAGFSWPLSNVWLGTSCEDQKRADERIPHLLRCPASVLFLSLEPLLGEMDLTAVEMPDGDGLGTYLFNHGEGCGINWVIVGGESGPGARPCNVEWVRSIVRQCKAAGVPVFVKQLGAKPIDCKTPNGRTDGHMKFVSRGESGGLVCSFCKPMKLADKKGGTMEEWPVDLRVREMP